MITVQQRFKLETLLHGDHNLDYETAGVVIVLVVQRFIKDFDLCTLYDLTLHYYCYLIVTVTSIA